MVAICINALNILSCEIDNNFNHFYPKQIVQ